MARPAYLSFDFGVALLFAIVLGLTVKPAEESW